MSIINASPQNTSVLAAPEWVHRLGASPTLKRMIGRKYRMPTGDEMVKLIDRQLPVAAIALSAVVPWAVNRAMDAVHLLDLTRPRPVIFGTAAVYLTHAVTRSIWAWRAVENNDPFLLRTPPPATVAQEEEDREHDEASLKIFALRKMKLAGTEEINEASIAAAVTVLDPTERFTALEQGKGLKGVIRSHGLKAALLDLPAATLLFVGVFTLLEQIHPTADGGLALLNPALALSGSYLPSLFNFGRISILQGIGYSLLARSIILELLPKG